MTEEGCRKNVIQPYVQACTEHRGVRCHAVTFKSRTDARSKRVQRESEQSYGICPERACRHRRIVCAKIAPLINQPDEGVRQHGEKPDNGEYQNEIVAVSDKNCILELPEVASSHFFRQIRRNCAPYRYPDYGKRELNKPGGEPEA
ncbi:MAG: hypothetical protein BWY06_03394 [Candidatus Latescibacteria bacterium ADurb.Bin168]|nr:MAG: hypothetical protein BWY06_03394 [Candidatus Latescibacteria bacterium ADurb.Bin168]